MTLDPSALAPAFASIGLPPPDGLTPLSPPWRHATWRVSFAPEHRLSDHVLRQVICDRAHDTLEHERTALSQLVDHALPVPRDFRRIPAALLPRPSAVCTFLPGTSGEELMRSAPSKAPKVAQRLGEVLTALGAVCLPAFGTTARAGAFVATGGSWREEWMMRVQRLDRSARMHGVDAGPLSRALVQHIEQRQDALDLVQDFALVHGDLHPGNLLLDPEASLTGVVDWEAAMAGDPLLDWVLPLLVPTATLGKVVTGAGHARVRRLLEGPGAHERLEVYLATHLLERLAFASLEPFRDQPTARAQVIAQVVLFARPLLDGDESVRDRFERALTHSADSEPMLSYARPSPRAVLLRRAAEALRASSFRTHAEAWSWIGAVYALELAEALPAEGPRILARAASLLEDVDGDMPTGGSTAASKGELRQRAETLAERTLATASKDPSACAASLAALTAGLALAEALDWNLADSVLEGLEALLAMATAPEASEPDSDQRALEELVALDALERASALVTPRLSGDVTKLRRRLEVRVNERLATGLVPVDGLESTTPPGLTVACYAAAMSALRAEEPPGEDTVKGR